MIKNSSTFILFFSCISIVQIHTAAFLNSAEPTRKNSARTRTERYHQGNLWMYEAHRNIQAQTGTLTPLPDASMLIEILAAKKHENRFVDFFVKEANIAGRLATKPFSRHQIHGVINEALEKFDPRFNRNNQIKFDQFQKLERFKKAMVTRVVKTRKKND